MGAEAGPYRAFFLGKGSKSSQLLYGWLGVTTPCGLVSVTCCDTFLDLLDDEIYSRSIVCLPNCSPAVCFRPSGCARPACASYEELLEIYGLIRYFWTSLDSSH